MMLVFLRRRGTHFAPLANLSSFPRILGFYSNSSTKLNQESEANQTQFPPSKSHLEGCRIELVDDESWRISSGLVNAFRGTNWELEKKKNKGLVSNEMDFNPSGEDDSDMGLDDLDDMRIKGRLFYKIDKESREFEEYNFEFHTKKKSPKNNNKNDSKDDSKDKQKKKMVSNAKLTSGADKHRPDLQEITDRRNPRRELVSERAMRLPKDVVTEEAQLTSKVNKSLRDRVDQNEITDRGNPRRDLVTEEALESDPWRYKVESLRGGKRIRTLTFNQVTAPYHEPFCLDIFVSKGSVRACIIHRATSSVVVVAHSISKDMKSDLSSLRNATTCAAVGEVLAQRALADDIHNVVYTPRKDERLEGKLLIVLDSIMDNGVSVKVKLRKRKAKRFFRQPLLD